MKKIVLGFIVLCFCSFSAFSAPVTVQIGSYDVGYFGFSGNSLGGMRHQALYLANEIVSGGGFKGSISDIKYYVVGNATTLTNLTVRMKHTSATNLPSFVDGPWHEFFFGDYSINTTGWVNVAGQNPFEWNGTDNIIIEYCWRNNTPGGNSAIAGSSFYVRDIIAQSSAPADGCTLTNANSCSAIPMIQLVMNPNAPTFAAGTLLENQNQNGGLFTAEITDAGSGAITEKGFCWNTAESPTITDHKQIVDGTEIGSLQANIVTMQSAQTFHVRPYAKNSLNMIAYGDEVVVSTIPTLGEWGLIAFGGLVAVIGCVVVWRRFA